MGRRPRILVAGGIYHVYNRVSRGAQVFRDDEEVDRLFRYQVRGSWEVVLGCPRD